MSIQAFEGIRCKLKELLAVQNNSSRIAAPLRTTSSPFLPATGRGKSPQWRWISTAAPPCLRKQTGRCRGPWRRSERWGSSSAQQPSRRVQSWATPQSPLQETKAEKTSPSVKPQLWKSVILSVPRLNSVISHPSRAGSHGTGWPQLSPCQSRPTRRKLPPRPGRRQSYEGCRRQSPSRPAEEPPSLGTQREACGVRADPGTVAIAPPCQATNCKVRHSSFVCAVHCDRAVQLTLMGWACCLSWFCGRYFCALQVLHSSL